MDDLIRWLPAVLAIIGGTVTYVVGWFENRRKEKRYVTRDAVTSLNAIVNAQSEQIRMLTESDARCQERLRIITEEKVDLEFTVHRLRNRVLELEKKVQ